MAAPRDCARASAIAAGPDLTPPVIYSLENRQKLVYLVEAAPLLNHAKPARSSMSRCLGHPMSEPAIQVTGLTKRRGPRTVVDDATLMLRAARSRVSGAERLGQDHDDPDDGYTPDAGEGRVLGHDIRREGTAIKRETGYMTQKFSFYEDLTLEENLNFVAGLYELPDPRRAVRDTLEDLGLSARRRQLAGSLSGGWKQRLALAACIMHRPQLLMLDEPTAGVDPKARRDFWDEIHGLASAGLTVLVSTHYMDEAERCHRINYIAYGKLVARGTVAEVVAGAGLSTFLLSGPRVAEAACALRGAPGVEQIAPFGNTLHLVGTDRAALEKTARAVVARPVPRLPPPKPAWKTCSSASWAPPRTTWHERAVFYCAVWGRCWPRKSSRTCHDRVTFAMMLGC
ncbi:MAG: ABC transporter ATP-binding protein [Paracoccaceae bacterium]